MTFVASSLPTRLASVCKEAGRPLPTFSDDDVVDFCVAEAVTIKYVEEREKAQKEHAAKQEREEFKGSHKNWRPGVGGV